MNIIKMIGKIVHAAPAENIMMFGYQKQIELVPALSPSSLRNKMGWWDVGFFCY